MITLRPVTEKDCKMVWSWANDRGVRSVSFSKDDIPYDSHIKWFKKKLNDPNCVFFIAEEINQKPVGQVRYDLVGDEATISVIVDDNFKGRGYGLQIIARASERIFKIRHVRKIHAYVMPENHASIKVFKKANFQLIESTTVNGQPASHFILSKKA
jgi:UDP-2,4-diacetamido-2,4,6-trideoxy-beta-L-altropyranose hydrolase